MNTLTIDPTHTRAQGNKTQQILFLLNVVAATAAAILIVYHQMMMHLIIIYLLSFGFRSRERKYEKCNMR